MRGCDEEIGQELLERQRAAMGADRGYGAKDQPAAGGLLGPSWGRAPAPLRWALAGALLVAMACAGAVAVRRGVALARRAGILVPSQVAAAEEPALFAEDRGLAALAACAHEGADCLRSRCCNAAGRKCFEKDAHFAACKPGCTPGVDRREPLKFQTPWSCRVLGGPGPGATLPPLAAYTVNKPRANSGCYVVSNGRLLVVKHSFGGVFDIPGGTADPGEVPETTACRETWEETGYKVKTTGLKRVMPNGFHIFNCQLLDPNQFRKPDPHEIAEVMWPALGALPQKNWRFQEELAIFR